MPACSPRGCVPAGALNVRSSETRSSSELVPAMLPGVIDDHFAGEVAARYDDSLGAVGSPQVLRPTVELLAGFAATGAALEMAVGTGRVALPLAARGVPVSGIELS